MGFLKKLFGNDSETMEEQPKKVEPVVEQPPKTGFGNTIPPASVEWLREQVIKALDIIGVDAQNAEEDGFFFFERTLDCEVKRCATYIFLTDQGIYCSAYFVTIIPQDRYQDIIELISRINHRFIAGHFDLDLQNGRLKYVTFLVNNGARTTMKDIVATIDTAYQILNGYGNAIVKTLKGIGTPERNVAKANEILFS